MGVCWAAEEPLTAADVHVRLDYPDAVVRNTVADASLALYRKGYLSRQLLNRKTWRYRPVRPIADHLALLIQHLVAASPDLALTLRLAPADVTGQPSTLTSWIWPQATGQCGEGV